MILHMAVLIAIFLFGGADAANRSVYTVPIPTSLAGTSWNSRFYHYCNFYVFETDSTGYSQDGQTAWSMAVDTVALGIGDDHFMYDNPKAFKYKIIDTMLTISYHHANGTNDEHDTREFYHRPKHGDWVSVYEYSYGAEVLRQGVKEEKYR